jgi:hypothetical protein
VVTSGGVRAALSAVIGELADRGGRGVVVEDEASRKRDPNPSQSGALETGFAGEQVLHWASLENDWDRAAATIERGSYRYPTNAFVSSGSPANLGLKEGAEVPSDLGRAVASSLVALIVAAYDGETYIIWEPGK